MNQDRIITSGAWQSGEYYKRHDIVYNNPNLAPPNTIYNPVDISGFNVTRLRDGKISIIPNGTTNHGWVVWKFDDEMVDEGADYTASIKSHYSGDAPADLLFYYNSGASVGIVDDIFRYNKERNLNLLYSHHTGDVDIAGGSNCILNVFDIASSIPTGAIFWHLKLESGNGVTTYNEGHETPLYCLSDHRSSGILNPYIQISDLPINTLYDTGLWSDKLHWSPSFNKSSKRVVENSRYNIFGDNYIQAVGGNISDSKMLFDLQYKNISNKEVSSIIHFTEYYGNFKSFGYNPEFPYDQQQDLKFLITDPPNISFDYFDSNSISFKIQQTDEKMLP